MAAIVKPYERLRFSNLADVTILREVISLNPYEDGERWKSITATVIRSINKNFTVRSVREHVDYLLKLWMKDDKTSLRRSLTIAEYTEKEQLLQEVSNIHRKYKILKLNKKSNDQTAGLQPFENLKAALGTTNELDIQISSYETSLESFDCGSPARLISQSPTHFISLPAPECILSTPVVSINMEPLEPIPRPIERLRFTNLDDITLLREVVSLNPYEDGELWKTILTTVIRKTNKNYSMRSIRDHVDHLLKLWAKEDKINLRKSGTEEEYSEKERLLQEVSDLHRDYKLSRLNKKTNDQTLELQDSESTIDNFKSAEETVSELDIPTSSYATSVESSDCESPTRIISQSPTHFISVTAPECILSSPTVSTAASVSGPIKNKRCRSKVRQATLEMLQERQKTELEIEAQKLKLEREKLQLEKEKFELERIEHQKKLELDMIEQEKKLELERTELEKKFELKSKRLDLDAERERNQKQVIDLLLKLVNQCNNNM
ncbi:hypothetical protein CHUAL_000690 [Chamberlinius hualienensis]